MSEFTYTSAVEKWGIFEVSMPGKSEGNPFTDYEITGTFTSKNEMKTVDGFPDKRTMGKSGTEFRQYCQNRTALPCREVSQKKCTAAHLQ